MFFIIQLCKCERLIRAEIVVTKFMIKKSLYKIYKIYETFVYICIKSKKMIVRLNKYEILRFLQ